MKKILLSTFTLFVGIFNLHAQNVNIPDANFKAYLVGNATINTNMDTEIQVSEATAFTGQINCSNQSISNLTGIEAFTSLTQLICYNNFTISSIDVSSISSLQMLYCSSNAITQLDLSNNPNLTFLACDDNELTSLNMANGFNSNIPNGSFYANANPNLTCIQVDDAAWSTSNWTTIDGTASFSENCSSCIVNIPDANFKTYLLGNIAINTNSDSEIQCSEAQAFTGYMDCSGLNIADLTGIEAFTALTNLNLGNNQLTSLDLSQNSALVILTCNSNQLTNVNVSQNSNLTWLELGGNQLTSLDVSQNTALDIFKCGANQLTNLDVSQNTALTNLICNSNQLTSLDVSQNTALTFLNCSDNQLSSLDVSNNSALTVLSCEINQISSLDISNSAALYYLWCQDNQLAFLNIANGNNTNFTSLKTQLNSNLSCIQVDDEVYSTTNWNTTNFTFDAGVSFSENCSLGIDEFSTFSLNLYPNPVVDHLTIQTESPIETVSIYNTNGQLLHVERDTVFSVAHLAKGMYTILIQSENGINTAKFIKE